MGISEKNRRHCRLVIHGRLTAGHRLRPATGDGDRCDIPLQLLYRLNSPGIPVAYYLLFFILDTVLDSLCSSLPLAAQHSLNFTLNLCFCTRGLAVAVVPHDPPCSVPLLVFIHLSVVPSDRDTRRSRPSEFRSYVVNYSASFSGISL